MASVMFDSFLHKISVVLFLLKKTCKLSRSLLTAQNSSLDKLLGQLGICATWLSSIAYLPKQLRIFIFFTPHFFSVITGFLIA